MSRGPTGAERAGVSREGPPRAAGIVLAIALLASAGCGGGERAPARALGDGAAAPSAPPAPQASAPPFGTVSAESAAADRAALAALPPSLATALAIEPYLTDRYLAATPGAECLVQSPEGATEARRRVHVRLPDRSALVVFARVDTAARAVHRVEIMRNPVGSEQVAFTLDGEGDVATVIRWPDRGRGKPASATHPRGGPLPRALRAYARRLWTLKCPVHGPKTE